MWYDVIISCRGCKKQTKKETKNMVTRDPVTGRFMKARRTQKKACACAKAKATTKKAATKKAATKSSAKKTTKKAKKA